MWQKKPSKKVLFTKNVAHGCAKKAKRENSVCL